METLYVENNVTPLRRRTLGETVQELTCEFSNMQVKLRNAYDEINRLQKEIARQEEQCAMFPQSNLTSLRRRVAYYCHPDRGGDTNLMGQLNMLFDYLEDSQRPAINVYQQENAS